MNRDVENITRILVNRILTNGNGIWVDFYNLSKRVGILAYAVFIKKTVVYQK